MKKILVISVILLTAYNSILAQVSNVSNVKKPLEVVKLMGDKLIRDTPFKYRLDVAPVGTTFDEMYFVDFGRTFSLGTPAVAYAYTELNSAQATKMNMEFEHNDAVKIWLNDALIYEKKGTKDIHLVYEERSIEMPYSIELNLKKGSNRLLIKSETAGKQWTVYVQPPSLKGAVPSESMKYPKIGIGGVKDVSSKIADLSNWLIIGPFDKGIDNEYAPEREFEFGKMYEGLNGQPVTWTIPKVEILGCSIDAKEWGTNYDWNYHNGGVAWAMQVLSEVTGDPKYNGYATDFCNFHLNGEPFVKHQVRTLNYVNSANHFFIRTPLLDFTLAPALPFIYRMRKESGFEFEDKYKVFVDDMVKYAREEQIRFPGSNIYTRVTPETYTTWVDDMFMGIPFLIQAAQYGDDQNAKNFFMNDAAEQLLNFSNFVWDKDAELYMHANYSQRPDVKLPHWTRANGWGIWATTEVLKILPKNHPSYKKVLAHYRKHVESLIKFQNENGFWYNVLEYPDSREEVSGTAILTMAIARGVTNGWLDSKKYRPIVENGWKALKTRIEPDGTVHDICYGTMCTEDVEYYKTRPFYDNDTHGLFAVIFAGIEVYNMENKK